MASRSRYAVYPSISAILDQHPSIHGAITSRTHLLSELSHSDSMTLSHEDHDNISSDSNSYSLSRTESAHTTSYCDREECERSCLRKVSHGFALLQKSLSIKSNAATVREYWRPDLGSGSGAQGRNDSTATTVVVSGCPTAKECTSVYSGSTVSEVVHKEDKKGQKKAKESGWLARCKAKAKRLRGSSGKYEELKECKSEKAARKEAKRERSEQKRKERREWLLTTGSDFNYGYHDIYGVSVGGAVDWRFCMGMIF